jgi:hypothetical protein
MLAMVSSERRLRRLRRTTAGAGTGAAADAGAAATARRFVGALALAVTLAPSATGLTRLSARLRPLTCTLSLAMGFPVEFMLWTALTPDRISPFSERAFCGLFQG